MLLRDFPQASSNPTNLVLVYPASVWSDPSPVLDAQHELESSSLFAKVDGPLDPNGSQLSVSEFIRLHDLLGAPKGLPALPPKGANVSITEYETLPRGSPIREQRRAGHPVRGGTLCGGSRFHRRSQCRTGD